MKKEELDPPRQPWETVEYTDDPDLPDIEHLTPVVDFLPRPAELVFKEPETEKISIVLAKKDVDFFRNEAKKLGASYQQMIRSLISAYVSRVSG